MLRVDHYRRLAFTVIGTALLGAGPAGCISGPATDTSAPPSPSHAARPAASATVPAAGPTRQPPRIRSVTVTPERITVLDCGRPSAPERPVVTVAVTSPDYQPGEYVVRLSFGVADSSYQGDVKMAFDRDRQAYVFTLPPIEEMAFGGKPKPVQMFAVIQGLPGTGEWEMPVSALITHESVCGGTIANTASGH
ncbi:hypothetical protein F4553_005110 [Allocatelliglobosispora scoriae]|uniref:Uncharacterized protein n=1 Tax=Allocatelliglobosispora scoriae TaxID=643052 RepID=A0A841BYI4_9ACTN|nr:hypothetical protein [Allocatelliglobosispora scoriae]MBB5871731.1 hypothetical protein [Allocatelliglobosispora scoriae]